MPAKKRTSSKPKTAAPQDEDGFDVPHHIHQAMQAALVFQTLKLNRFVRYIFEDAKAGNTESMLRAGERLVCEVSLADPETWQRTTGRELPRNVEELRSLMVEAGYSPDFISAGDWTPREVGPVLMQRLAIAGFSEPMDKADIAKQINRSIKQLGRWVTTGKIELQPCGGKWRYRLPEK